MLALLMRVGAFPDVGSVMVWLVKNSTLILIYGMSL
jgi:hypothetical protein